MKPKGQGAKQALEKRWASPVFVSGSFFDETNRLAHSGGAAAKSGQPLPIRFLSLKRAP